MTWHGSLGLAVTVGGGPGLTHGYGTPRYRVLTAIAFTPGAAADARRRNVHATQAPGPAPLAAAPEPELAPPATAAPAESAVTIASAAAPERRGEPSRQVGQVAFSFDSARVGEHASPALDGIAAPHEG